MNKVFRSLAVTILLFTASADLACAYRPVPIVIEIRGDSSEPAVVNGWCDIEIGHRSLNRIDISGRTGEIDPIKVNARRVDRCEITRDPASNAFTLVITEDDREVFNRTTGAEETMLRYGPTMERYSTQPPTMR